MKSDLKRIEAALQKAACQTTRPDDFSSFSPDANPFMDWCDAVQGLEEGAEPIATGESSASGLVSRATLNHMTPIAMALSVSAGSDRTPDLPGFVVSSSESSRQQAMATPALAANLLSDLQNRVNEWTLSLQQILEQIQALHGEGAVVEGWLESSGTTYRLCGVNEEGQLWHRPCSNEEIREVSLAIVRYQRLQQLLSQQRSLEICLTYLTETLLSTYGRLAELS